MDQAIAYEYTKQRRDFGHHPNFSDSAPLQSDVPPSEQDGRQWTMAVSSVVELDCIPVLAQHEVNTERFVQAAKGVSHTEGAWPTEIKTNEWVDRQRYLRRIMNDASFISSIPNLCTHVEGIIKQNNTIDLYEEYFNGPDYDLPFSTAPHSVKTVAVFRDPHYLANNPGRRAATKISWHPDGAHKVAVAHSCLQFQAAPLATTASMSAAERSSLAASFIWDLNKPNSPEQELLPPSPLVSLAFNPRSPDHILGGCYNGLLSFFDLRKGTKESENSALEKSHRDPVYDVQWIQSRSGNECVSVSTDGQLLWWDVRKLKQGPTDSMLLQSEDNGIVYGGTSLEYKTDAGATRYLVGSEQGVSFLVDRKAKKDSESSKQMKQVFGQGGGAHHGPVVSLQRSPFFPKFFLSAGDWSSRIYMEDLRSPIFQTRYETRAAAYVSAAAWSPSRPAVFLSCKEDGTLDCWDLVHKHQAPVFSTKICDVPLTSIKLHSTGRLAAVGAQDGSVCVLRLSSSLSELQREEKMQVQLMFEREKEREKNLEKVLLLKKRDRELKDKEKERQLKQQQDFKDAKSEDADEVFDEETKESIKKAEEEFYTLMASSLTNKDDVSSPSESSKQDLSEKFEEESKEESKETTTQAQ